VAVATIKTEDLDAAGLERVRREAQAMGRLGNHPHIVTVYDIGEEGGRPYIVSQYMPGGSVDGLLEAATEHRLPLSDALRIGDQICQALDHAHSQGIVHRDIKPANIWLGEDGTARLGDFGLAAGAASAERSRLTKEGMMVGTVAYMAPEQALGQEVDVRADLYSLGALLYELLTGRPPFVGPDAVSVISQQINTPPMAPWWHNPAVPKEVGTVVLELLAKTPEERPAGAAEVRRRLAEALTSAGPKGDDQSPETPSPADRRHTARLNRVSRFVGRAVELRDLKRAVEGALAGRGGLIMVSGEPGIGKTRLAEEACVYARLGGAQVLTGHSYEAESAVPYTPFTEAIRAYVAGRPPDAVRAELGEAASEVAKLVSDIRDVVPGLPETSRPADDEERYRLFESVCSFLVNASRSVPIVLLLDNLHWADVPSLRLLEHLSRRLADSRLLVIGTYRDVELSRRHPLVEALVELRRAPSFQLIVLRGLTLSEVQDFLEGITERTLEPAEQPLAAAFYGETEGNPYFLEEVVRHMLDTGGAFWEEGRWQLNQVSIESLSIPEGIRALVDRRLSGLSETGRDVLTKAAVVGAQFDFAVLAQMTGLDEDDLLLALEAALEAQLVEPAAARHGHAFYRFTHAVIRQSLYESLSLPRRQRLHRRAAEAIEAAYARNLGPFLPALALHYRQAGDAADPALAADYSIRAGDAALGVFAYEDAAEHWEAALELLEDGAGDDAAQARLLARLGDVNYVSGLDYDRSTACLIKSLALYETLGMAEQAAQVHARLGRNFSSFPGYLDITRALRHQAAAEAILSGRPRIGSLGYLYAGRAAANHYGLRVSEGLADAQRAISIADEVGNVRLRRQATALLGALLGDAGRGAEAMAVLQDNWAEADAANDLTVAFASTWSAASQAFRLADPETALRWCRRELSGARFSQTPYWRRLLLDLRGRAEAVTGDLEAARRTRDEAGVSRYAAPSIALFEGRLDDAAHLWETGRADNRRSGNRYDEWTDIVHIALVHRLQGRPEKAETLLGEALSMSVDVGQHVPEVATRIELATFLADSDRAAEAREHLGRAEELMADGEDWRGLHGRVARAEAALLAAEGRVDAAREKYASAIEIFQRLKLAWDVADARRRLGELGRQVGDRTDAVREYAAALELLRRHGAGNAWIEPLVAEKLTAEGVDSSSGVLSSIHVVAAAVDDERPDLAPLTSPEGTVTLLFSDIEGSTAANERLGDQRWMEILRMHNQIFRDGVARHGGFEVKSQGDGFMVAFSGARSGLASAVAIQRALQAHAEAHPDEAIRVRMGLHTGEAVKEGDDFFGTHVALAARIAAAARGGEILVSSLLKELSDGSGEFAFGPGRDIDLKGFSVSRRVHPLLWQEEAAETAAAVSDPLSTSGSYRLVTLLVTEGHGNWNGNGIGGLAEVTGEHGEILPDGDVIAFASAADAVAATVRLHGAEPTLRIGLHAAVLGADGVAGQETDVALARRLSGHAAGGQVICSGIVARLLAGRPRLAFVPLPAEVGGRHDPDGAFELRTDAGGGPFSPPTTLIGRQAEVGQLLERIEQAAAGRGGLAILAGEQGIGKTRLVDEIATQVERLGFSVLWGRCHEGDWPPPYGPFIEVLEAQAALCDVAELRRDLGDAAGVVAQLVPAVRRLLPDAASAPVPPEEERHRVLDGVGRFLVARSRHVPVVLILDDLHWADRATVALLRHLVHLVASERLLVVGTYRDVDLDRAHPLADALAAWPREAGYDHLRIDSLGPEEVTEFLGAVGGQEYEVKVGRAWARETGGNPFFILEVMRHLHEEGKLYRGVDGGWMTAARLRDLALPVAARDVALRRVERLSEDAKRLLSVAAAFEGAFRFEVVADLAGLSEDTGLDALDEAVGARILEPSGDSETYTFTHAVIRHALYDGLVPSRRSRLHRRVAEALAGAGSGRAAASPAEIAVHYHRSVALPGAERGVEPAVGAADQAQATGAYDEAGKFLRMALDLLPRDDDRRPRLLGRLGIVLAWALDFDDATGVAASAGDAIAAAETEQAAAEYLANAAYACAQAGGIIPSWKLAGQGLGYATARDVAWARLTCFDYQRREAEDADGPGIPIDSSERREAAAILRAARLDPMGPAPMEAACASRQEALASTNLAIQFYWCGEYVGRALPMLEAEAKQATARGQLARAGRCRAFVAMCQASLGNLDEARKALDQTQALAARLGASIFPALQARECLAIATDEDLEELADAFAPLTASVIPPIAWLYGCLYAWSSRIAARLGRAEEALKSLSLLTPWLERGPAWTIGFPVIASHAAETLWVLGRDDHLPVIERALRDKVIAPDFRSTGADGRLAMARLCGLSGRHDEAMAWFADARRVLTDQGARPLLAIADYDEALMFLRRGEPDDGDRARPLLEAARRQFEEIGMTGWLARAEELRTL
jgi:predicted ATPase/class 3 adenylate cyclase